MNKKESKLNTLLNKYFADKKKRPIATLIVILPFIIVMVIFGVGIFNQAKDLIGLAIDNGPTNTNSAYSINDNSFVLRDSATEIQKQYFAELKDMYENKESVATAQDKVISTVKNYVADFYTWSNKLGQYDVGGMYYVYDPQRETIYIQARDQFYKYLNNYINDYGVENLLEVESVEATVNGSEFKFSIDEQEYSAYKVTANWTYIQKESNFSTSKYDTKAYFVVINNNERYEIIYAGNKEYTPNEEAE